MTGVPPIRIRLASPRPPRADGDFVLYWMIAARRVRMNFALERAVEWARQLDRPLVALEALRCDYPWASDRLHRFVLDGMGDNRRAFARTAVLYHPYVEPARHAGRGLLESLAARACVVVTDEFPGFFLPGMVAAAARGPVLLEAIDSNGLLPLAATTAAASTAFAFRRILQRELPRHLGQVPKADPLARVALPCLRELPREIARRWPAASEELLEGKPAALAALPIDHRVAPAPSRGGAAAGRAVLRSFVQEGLARYADARNHPDDDATSGLSAYLHFGHVAAHEVFAAVAEREGWSAERLATRATGGRTGWWGMSDSGESFLDQLVTWRELAYNFCFHRDDADRLESLPGWARRTLAAHARDRRPHVYSRDQLEEAVTDDEIWNAAQRQLRREGRIHTYLRMLWGKKILEWSPAPEEAAARMIALNDRYALDGRDPNSYAGIFWCLGRYDRPWGPERAIFGVVRYMSSASTARKVRLRRYLARYEA